MKGPLVGYHWLKAQKIIRAGDREQQREMKLPRLKLVDRERPFSGPNHVFPPVVEARFVRC